MSLYEYPLLKKCLILYIISLGLNGLHIKYSTGGPSFIAFNLSSFKSTLLTKLATDLLTLNVVKILWIFHSYFEFINSFAFIK